MFRRLALVLAIMASACGDDSGSQTAPTSSTATITLSGTVSSTAGPRVNGATIRFLDGINSGRTATTNSNGEYSFGTVQGGNANLAAAAPGYLEDRRGMTINSTSTTLAFTLQPAPIWSMSGSGNSVFDMPSFVARVRIRGVWSGSGTSNFIVRVAGRSIVNEVLRDLPNRTYEGVHLVSGGGVVEIVSSGNIASWTFTEER